MAQFTPTDIARILTEVPADTAIQGIEEAGLTRVLTTDALETLSEIAGYLNLASNLLVFGPAIADKAATELLEGIEKSEGFKNLQRLAERVSGVTTFFQLMATAINKTRELVEESLNLEGIPVETVDRVVGYAQEIEQTAIDVEISSGNYLLIADLFKLRRIALLAEYIRDDLT